MRRTAVLALALATVGASPRARAQDTHDALTADAIFKQGEFRGAPIPEPQWLPGGDAYVDLKLTPAGVAIARVDAATGASTVLADPSSLVDERGRPIAVEAVTLSKDGGKALLFHDSQRVWRYHTRGRFHVLDLKTHRITPVSRNPGMQMFATFSPDGRMVAFVRANNLFVTDLATGTERALTKDGSDVIINGTSDWVYEEELDIRNAFRWSPDSRRIAFWRLDQSPVPKYPLVDQTTPSPKIFWYRYPMAGQPNSKVSVGIVDVATGATRFVQPLAGSEYVAALDWAGADSVTIQEMPRRQDRIELRMVSASTGKGRVVLTERADSAWVDIDEASPRWLNGGREFLWASERGGWRQYWLYERNGRVVRRVTADSVDATALAGVDDARGMLYAIEAAPTPMERRLVRYDLKRAGERVVVSRERGTVRADIAPGAKWMVEMHTTVATPAVASLVALPAGEPRHVLESNAPLRAKMERLTRAPEFFHIPMPDGVRLNAYRILPKDFESTRRYPVIIYVYGGPESQTVTDDWGGSRYLWHQMMAQ